MPYAPKTHRALPRTALPKKDFRPSSAKRGYGREWRERRLRILARDKYTCQIPGCGKVTGKSGHVDHILAKAKGGTDDDDNLRTTCHSCHSRKTVQEDGGRPQ